MRILFALLFLSSVAVAQVPQAALQYRAEMTRSAYRVHGPAAPVAALAGQIHQESAWKIDAKSWAGAEGLAQFMPLTAKDMAARYPSDCAPANPYSARWAFTCRDRYMASQLKGSRQMKTGMDEKSHWAFAFRAYNGGLGWINRDRRMCLLAAGCPGCNPDDHEQVMPFNAGRRASAHKENREYAIRIFALQPRYAEWGRSL